jgi:cell shape-determining protein MreC
MFSQKPKKKKTFIIISFILFLIIIIFLFRKNLSPLFIKSLNYFDFKQSFLQTNTTNEELKILQTELVLLKSENNELKKLTSESQHSSSTEITTKLIPLELLASKSNIYNSFWGEIPKNSTSSVAVGNFVYSRDNIIIGKISYISDNKIKVDFLGSTDSFIAETLESKESLELKANGIGLYTGKISKASEIKNGDIVIIKNKENAIVGNVIDITDDNSSMIIVWVRTPQNINKVKTFYVESN